MNNDRQRPMPDRRLEAIESSQQLTETWAKFVLDHGPGDVRDLPGISIRWADSKFPFWNCITFTDHGTNPSLLETRLAQSVALMRQKSQPGLIWVFEDLLDPSASAALSAAAERAGLSLALRGFGMAGDVLPIPEPHHPDLTFVRVTTEDHLTAYADLNSRAYGMPVEAGRDGLCGSELWKSGMYAYLGLNDGVPVAAAATIETDGRLFVALVATAPEAQRKGYGEAVTRKALFEGAKATGLTRATLHATLAGAPVYERIGLHTTAAMSFYGLAA
jgi:GNAT superfamily N-acetyltransferase